MRVVLVLLCSFISFGVFAQPPYYKRSASFDRELERIVAAAGLDSSWDAGEDGFETVSIAVIDLTKKRPLLGGVHLNNFIYPASVYKMYVAMEVLKQVSEGKYALYQPYIVRQPNDVDRSREIAWDPRPLLKQGDTVTIYYLLDLMITRSDNTAANCLIDLAGRININQTMRSYGWQGSEVTRKFLKRSHEDPGYDTVRSTETNALHAADFLYRITKGTLVNQWVSSLLKNLLGAQLDSSKLAAGLPAKTMFYHKTGWWSIYTHDVGIVEDGNVRYIIAAFLPLTEAAARPRMKILGEKVHALMLQWK